MRTRSGIRKIHLKIAFFGLIWASLFFPLIQTQGQSLPVDEAQLIEDLIEQGLTTMVLIVGSLIEAVWLLIISIIDIGWSVVFLIVLLLTALVLTKRFIY